MSSVTKEEFELFSSMLRGAGLDFVKLAFLIFPYGQKGHELEHKRPHAWQLHEWQMMTKWFNDPETKDKTYKVAISTGNGSGKTAWAAQTNIILLYIRKLRARVTGNTKPQLQQVIWPEYDKWLRYARYSAELFEKLGEAIKSNDELLRDQWQISLFTWDADNPAAVSGLHNEGHATCYTFEEAPGIPAVIFQYANGAFTDINTLKLWIVLGNSDDPDSKFEQLMADPSWRAVRIDTRTLPHVSKDFIATVLRDCGGDEDADDFRVRVRGLPRKTNQDAIINRDRVRAAFARAVDFDPASVAHLPCVMTIDTAWTGTDYNTIWIHQGHYHKLVAAHKIDKTLGEDHSKTFRIARKLCGEYKVDAVLIDQGEGTALKTLANMNQLWHWELVNFGAGPNDNIDPKNSEYANMRSQMYHEAGKYFNHDYCVLDVDATIVIEGQDGVVEKIIKQMGYTKGDRHKITQKKTCENKKELKLRVGESPDFADGFVLKFGRVVEHRLPEHEPFDPDNRPGPGSGAWVVEPAHVDYDEQYEIKY